MNYTHTKGREVSSPRFMHEGDVAAVNLHFFFSHELQRTLNGGASQASLKRAAALSSSVLLIFFNPSRRFVPLF